jgi:rhamnogalacturonan endolyase
MSLKRFCLAVTLCAVFAALTGALSVASAATITLGSNADTYLRDATVRGALAFMDVRGAALDFRGYLRFDLSSIPAGSTINSATLVLTQVPGASRNDAIVAARFALYGLNNDAGNTPQNWDEATFVPAAKGTEDVTTLLGVTDLDDNVAGISETIAGAAGAAIVTVSGAPLASFLQTRFGNGGLTTFILSNDDATDRGYGLGTKENADPLTHPALTIDFTLVPEPTACGLLAMGCVLAVSFKQAGRPRRPGCERHCSPS